jgi:heparinase II/III-like protein
MKLILNDGVVAARGAIARTELAPLAQALAAELQRVEEQELYIPKEKALLSRAGGRCERDGTTLEFDPFSPHRHRCPTCGTIHVGELHDRFWVFWYQLWLAERALHGALLGRLLCDERALALSVAILERYGDEYLLYPNRDNVLGPTRLFFSTYLESIWLLNISIALDLLEADGSTGALGGRVRERIIAPAAELIASYDEGASNRQVWNDAALLAAGRLLDARELVDAAVHGQSGLVYHLEHGLLADGTWYEGENYHLFAHRGLWYGVTMAERAAIELPPEAVGRFREGFAAPFLTALPDLTLPSRRDSQYAISLRQPRFAELCELGLAREKGEGDPRLRAMLRRLYEDPYPRSEIGRSTSTADVERNLPGTALTRADLGWRSLLFARPVLPPLIDAPLGTVLLDAQGIAVFRRENDSVYVALDYGTSGGGHGHPDRLNVLLSEGETRWLDDMGTGSYVDPSLHWYRSTLAHNAPLFNGCEQQRVDGELLAYEEQEESGWVCARVRELYPGVTTMRTIVATSAYVLDELAWEADDHMDLAMDLPIHVAPVAMHLRSFARGRHVDVLGAESPLEDTMGFLESSYGRWMDTHTVARITARDGEQVLNGFVLCSLPYVIYRATAPGAPGRGPHPFIVLRVPSRGEAAWVRVLWDWRGDIETVWVPPSGAATFVERRDASHDRLRQTTTGYRIDRVTGAGTTRIDLGGMVALRGSATPTSEGQPPPPLSLSAGRPKVFELGEEQYRQSEQTWEEAGRPAAKLTIVMEPNELVIGIRVHKPGPLTFAAANAVNRYDNESPDINGDGVQLYIADERGAGGWVLVPADAGDENAGVRARVIDGWADARHLHAEWHRLAEGYELRVHLEHTARSGEPYVFSLGVVVNEKPSERERRRGQLVLGGHPGEFVYLRGDREVLARLPRFRATL